MAKNKCWCCGKEADSKRQIEMHHVLSRDVNESWVIPLCRTCHDLIDRKPVRDWPQSLYWNAVEEVLQLPEAKMLMLKYLVCAARLENEFEIERDVFEALKLEYDLVTVRVN